MNNGLMNDVLIIHITSFFVGMIAYVLSSKLKLGIITIIISIIIWSLLIIHISN